MSMLSNRMALGTATALACVGLIADFPKFRRSLATKNIPIPSLIRTPRCKAAPNTSTKTDTIIASDMQALALSEAEVDSDHICLSHALSRA